MSDVPDPEVIDEALAEAVTDATDEPLDATDESPAGPGARDDAPPPLAVSDLPGGARAAIEAILAVADDAVAPPRLAAVLGLSVAEVSRLLRTLADDYRATDRGYELREINGAWRLYSAPVFGPYVEAFVLDGQTARLTQASLETLAVVAYRQPVSRGRIAAVRGVNVDGVVRTLVSRGLIEEAGRDGEGGAILYRTTSYFLARMGLSSLSDLPPLAPYLPDMAELGEIEEELR
ncbi:MAG: SMC-Scp complex subunit ScpB [Salana multivorans]|nr:SMC-Scp complex subunit ScpB [Salana multivorans]